MKQDIFFDSAFFIMLKPKTLNKAYCKRPTSRMQCSTSHHTFRLLPSRQTRDTPQLLIQSHSATRIKSPTTPLRRVNRVSTRSILPATSRQSQPPLTHEDLQFLEHLAQIIKQQGQRPSQLRVLSLMALVALSLRKSKRVPFTINIGTVEQNTRKLVYKDQQLLARLDASVKSKLAVMLDMARRLIGEADLFQFMLAMIKTKLTANKLVSCWLRVNYILAHFLLQSKKFNQFLALSKYCKNQCQLHGNRRLKLKFYRLISKGLKVLREFSYSLIYFSKTLKLAWLLGHQRYELEVYDHVGQIYSCKGVSQTAIYYRWKMETGDYEELDNQLVQKQIESLQKRSFSNKQNATYIGRFEISSSQEESQHFFDQFFTIKTKLWNIPKKAACCIDSGPNRCMDRFFKNHLRERNQLCYSSLKGGVRKRLQRKLTKLKSVFLI